MFESWPFTDFHNLNLDWIVGRIKNVETSEANAKASEEAAAESASAADTSATNAATSEEHAENSAAAAAVSETNIRNTENQLSILEERVNNIVANAGDTDNNAELLDIRVGYDGTTFDTAGNAVRSEAAKTEIALTLNDGYIGSDGNAVAPAGNMENWTTPIPVYPGEVLRLKYSITPTDNWWLQVAYYTASGAFITRTGIVSYVQGTDYAANVTVPADAYFAVFTFRLYNTDGAFHVYRTGRSLYHESIERNLTGLNIGLGTLSPNTGMLIIAPGAFRRLVSEYVKIVDKVLKMSNLGSYTEGYDVYYYDESGAFLSHKGFDTLAGGASTTVTPPAGALWARITFDDSTASQSGNGYTVQQLAEYFNIELLDNNATEYRAISQASSVKAVAHRGLSSAAPENTIPAYKEAAAAYFPYVETDIALTSDDVPVLLHDSTINRTARNLDGTSIEGTININDVTYNNVYTNYDFGIWKGPQYAGTHIPTLEEFMRTCRDLGLKAYLELKTHQVYSDTNLRNILDIVDHAGMTGRVSWISGDPTLLGRVHQKDPAARIGYVTSNPDTNDVDIIRNLKGANEVFIDTQNISAETLAYCKEYDVPVERWTFNDATSITGADVYTSGFTSNNINAAIALYDNAI